MRAGLSAAMKSRDRAAASALRSALAAVDNAEAVDVAEHRAGALENSATGLGVAEVARRQLTEQDIEQIVRAEVDERRKVAGQYESLGQTDRAATLHAEAEALTGLL